MANDISNSPLVIDTASATAITTRTFTAYMIRWVSGSAAAGDLATVQDRNGRVKWASVAAGANYVEETQWVKKYLIFDGLIVPTLTSGTVYIYIYDGVPIRI